MADAKYGRMPQEDPMDEMEMPGEAGMEEGEGELTIPFTDLPEAESWEDGMEYEITVKQTGHGKDSATFEVVDAGPVAEEEKGEAKGEGAETVEGE